MEVVVGARSDVGLVRTNNEDQYAVEPSLKLFVLCDGMGGQAAGEVASRMAVDAVLVHCRAAAQDPQVPLAGPVRDEFSTETNRLASAIRLANSAIFQAASSAASVNGMGCTVAAVRVWGSVMSMAHVGDSRIYLFRSGQLRQLTEDHSLVQEHVKRGLLTPEQAKTSDMSNVILRALGMEPSVEIDLNEIWVGPGDQVLLCSDGLTRMAPDEQIAETLEASDTAQEAADQLVELANRRGGEDNITVIVARLLASASGWKRWVRR